jgi:hypothetical protein
LKKKEEEEEEEECAKTGDVRRNTRKRVLIITKYIDGHCI